MYNDEGLGILPVEEPKYMPTANRGRWMQDYMKEYRQGRLRGDTAGRHPDPTRCEKLKTAQRLYSFKWRLSKLLSPQYKILLCIQYTTHDSEIAHDGSLHVVDKECCSDMLITVDHLSIFDEEFSKLYSIGDDDGLFNKLGDIGDGELFKVFLLEKYSKDFDRATRFVIGVLDKAIILENLQQLLNQDSGKWEKILNKVQAEAR